jgi:four helix bundle protein
MKNKEFARALEARTLKFAVSIIKLAAKLPNSAEGRVVRTQITKSGTSPGANYREANRSRSKADFKSRIRICESELSETQYWLDVIVAVGWLNFSDIKAEHDECGQLLALFATIAKNC